MVPMYLQICLTYSLKHFTFHYFFPLEPLLDMRCYKPSPIKGLAVCRAFVHDQIIMHVKLEIFDSEIQLFYFILI